MGFLTVLQLYHDRIHQIEADPNRFVEELLTALSHGDGDTIFGQTTVMPYKHSDDPELYLLMGNCLTEMDPDSRTTQKNIENCPDFYREQIRFIEKRLKGLRARLEEAEKSPKS